MPRSRQPNARTADCGRRDVAIPMGDPAGATVDLGIAMSIARVVPRAPHMPADRAIERRDDHWPTEH